MQKANVLRRSVLRLRTLWRALALRNRKPDESSYEFFSDVAARHPSDKWLTHGYAPLYYTHFREFRTKHLNILEIGVGGYSEGSYGNPMLGGHSLRFWKEYFPNSRIFGVDIEDKRALQEERIVVLQGSQDNESFLRGIHERAGSIDIVIDDGSHISRHVILAFNVLFPLLSDSGIYIVEDTQASYWPSYGGDNVSFNNPQTTMGFFKGLVDGLNHAEIPRPGYKPTALDLNIAAIHFYHNLIVIHKGRNDHPSNMVKDGILTA